MPSRSGEILYDLRRSPLTLGRLLKSGGAGSVFTLHERPRDVAKLYHSSKDGHAYERKVRAMLELQPDLPPVLDNGSAQVQIAWPNGMLRDGQGRFVGFTMPILDVAATSDLEHVLQERQARAEGLPTALGPKMTLAANLAVMLAALHRRGHYVVDLKPLNVRFYRQSLFVAMLDCDGFSIQGKGERFPAGQVTADYLAAEFQGRGVKPGEEEAQDRFALAVMLFQLLNTGLHPYAGRPQGSDLPSDLPGRIAAHLYAYGRKADARILPALASGHQAFPDEIRDLFDRAFSRQPRRRPSAEEWGRLLSRYARRTAGKLVACGKDATHQHFDGLPCAACARTALLASAAPAARPGRGRGNRADRRRQQGQVARRQRQAAVAPQATQARGRRPAVATPAQQLAGPVGLGTRVAMSVIGTLLLGWVMGWGMPAYRDYLAHEQPRWGDAFALGLQGGLLVLGLLLFILFVPLIILGKRP
ncbi:hypothetical protein [Stenotrophomonas sp. 24(2023)]|uniref:hypothetical protein n=1 Tax=Stenotrophomonas sp. 24(2023) TaxID=3068324 RepID=UPI0027DF23B9|nr:hypothetical protein [Stenotrophomonas sp. 24(2023)]WMJ68362.1 hypothetical protein Q9R17_14310 [Stenotrophomonas sp. 24(2023)]